MLTSESGGGGEGKKSKAFTSCFNHTLNVQRPNLNDNPETTGQILAKYLEFWFQIQERVSNKTPPGSTVPGPILASVWMAELRKAGIP